MVTCRFQFLRAGVVAVAAMSAQSASSAAGGGALWTTGGYDAQNTRYNSERTTFSLTRHARKLQHTEASREMRPHGSRRIRRSKKFQPVNEAIRC